MIDKEYKQRMECFQVTLQCDCGRDFKRLPGVFTSSPPQYEYYCQPCNIKTRSFIDYPELRYQPIGEKEIIK
jgi:hypothetical protein